MAIFWNGQGGTVAFTPTGGSLMIVANKSWKKSKKNKTNEVTNATSGGQTQKIIGVNEQSGTFDVFYDSLLQPEANGLVEGNTGILTERLGNSGHGYTQGVIIEEIAPAVDSQSGAVMYSVSYSGITAVTAF